MCRADRQGDGRGVTLWEVLVALSVLAIVGLASVLALEPVRARWLLHRATRELALAVMETRRRAAATGIPHRLRIDDDGRYLREHQAGVGFTAAAPPLAPPPGILVEACTAPDCAITFQPRGHATTFGSVVLAHPAGLSRRVIVNIAGRTRVE